MNLANKKRKQKMSNWAQTVFEKTQALPWLISLALFAFSLGRNRHGKWGAELSITLYFQWSWVMQFFIWILDANFQVLRPNPYDPSIVESTYPSNVTFWCFSLITYVVTYAWLWEAVLSSKYWTIMLLFGFGPPTVLVWFMYNTWFEVLTSALLGIVLTAPFVLWMRYALEESDITIMLGQRPWTWFSAIDTHLRSLEEIESAKT